MRGTYMYQKRKKKKRQVLPYLLIQSSLSRGDNGLRKVKAAGSSQFQKCIIYNSEVISGNHGVGGQKKNLFLSGMYFSLGVPKNKQREHLEFIKDLKYNKNAYISEGT